MTTPRPTLSSSAILAVPRPAPLRPVVHGEHDAAAEPRPCSAAPPSGDGLGAFRGMAIGLAAEAIIGIVAVSGWHLIRWCLS